MKERYWDGEGFVDTLPALELTRGQMEELGAMVRAISENLYVQVPHQLGTFSVNYGRFAAGDPAAGVRWIELAHVEDFEELRDIVGFAAQDLMDEVVSK